MPSSIIVLKVELNKFPASEEDGGTNGLNSSFVVNKRSVELFAEPLVGVVSSCSVAASYDGGR